MRAFIGKIDSLNRNIPADVGGGYNEIVPIAFIPLPILTRLVWLTPSIRRSASTGDWDLRRLTRTTTRFGVDLLHRYGSILLAHFSMFSEGVSLISLSIIQPFLLC